MILLIVDDEPDVLDGILSGVDVESLGFTRVYTANSGEEAMQIMLRCAVDVLISDIEMSDMSGLSLLEWARQNQKEVVTIFCTAYSDFNYAKKAVELHAFDYYLKPIRYEELRAKLAAAAEQVRSRQMAENIDSTDIRRQQRFYFWSQMLHRFETGRVRLSDEKENWMVEEARSRKLPYEESDLLTFLVFDLYQEDKLRDWNPSLMDTAFENVLSELFLLEGTAIEAITTMHPGAYQLILYQQSQKPIDREKLQAACKKFIDFCNRHMDISADCYYCTDIAYNRMAEILVKVNDIFRDDVCSQNQLYDIFTYRKKDSEYINADFSAQLEKKLQQGQWDSVLQIMTQGLQDGVARGVITSSGLLAVQLDFLQVIHSFLQSHGIAAHTLFFNDEYRKLYESAKDAVDATLKFVGYVLQKTQVAISCSAGSVKPEDNASAVETVQTYINDHLSEDLNRSVLARTVFLNPDYLAKLFKEKTGQSLAAYVKNQRIERAKLLLTETDIPIGSIAQQIGYDNLSYFSSIFHDKTGLQPGEYRRQARKD